MDNIRINIIDKTTPVPMCKSCCTKDATWEYRIGPVEFGINFHLCDRCSNELSFMAGDADNSRCVMSKIIKLIDEWKGYQK